MIASQWWQEYLTQLLDRGAQLHVTNPDGAAAFTAPLARVCRLEDDSLLWIRPLAHSTNGSDGTTVFALSRCRRRCLSVAGVRRVDQDLVFVLSSGQSARIGPADGDAAAELRRWDTFVGARLSAREELTLDALAEDSWFGRFG